MAAKLGKRDCNGGDGGGLSLPEEMILEVLLLLPAKALCRFRCVSKSWHALISDPAFVAAQRSRATGPFIVAVFGSIPEHELRLLDKGGNVLMVFDIRGPTALLAPTCLDLVFVDRGQLGVMIIDPASGRDFIVGTDDSPPHMDLLTCDYSFGRAAASGDYKVLRLVTLKHDVTNRLYQWCEVATILDGGGEPAWRPRPLGTFSQTTFSWEDKTTINGNLYFMISDIYPSPHDRKRIAAFDLESEEWKAGLILGPLLEHKNIYDTWSIALTKLKGTLCMVHSVHLPGLVGHYANIWLLKDANSCAWVKEYKIKMPERSLLFTKPLDVLIDGKLLLLNKYRKAENTKNSHRYILQLYNPSTKAFTDFMEMAEGFNGRMAFYTGNLLC